MVNFKKSKMVRFSGFEILKFSNDIVPISFDRECKVPITQDVVTNIENEQKANSILTDYIKITHWERFEENVEFLGGDK